MIISRTPFRISFFGGGTDYPAWIKEHGGAVVATTFDKYCWITCRHLPPFFEHKSRVLYSFIENVKSNDEIRHPAVRAGLKLMGIDYGVEIHHDGDLPARTGLGSSSAFAVGLLNVLHKLEGKRIGKMELAEKAIHVEQDMLKENVGCQDQVIAALGGLQRIDFLPDGRIKARPLRVSPSRRKALRSHMLLYFTGFSRIASEIVKEQLRRMPDKTAQLLRMRRMVDEGQELLEKGGDLRDFGALLDEGWSLKRGLSSKISTPAIDELYGAAKAAGALGGKLLGAGGGGFMLLFARPRDHARIKARLKKLLHIPFDFEDEGSRIIFSHEQAYKHPK